MSFDSLGVGVLAVYVGVLLLVTEVARRARRDLSPADHFLALQARLVVYDSIGSNPVVLTTFPSPDPLGGACRPILIASAGFENVTNPPVDTAVR